jgi:hypothetical protein
MLLATLIKSASSVLRVAHGVLMETIDSLSDIEVSIAIPSGRFKKISKCDLSTLLNLL